MLGVSKSFRGWTPPVGGVDNSLELSDDAYLCCTVMLRTLRRRFTVARRLRRHQNSSLRRWPTRLTVDTFSPCVCIHWLSVACMWVVLLCDVCVTTQLNLCTDFVNWRNDVALLASGECQSPTGSKLTGRDDAGRGIRFHAWLNKPEVERETLLNGLILTELTIFLNTFSISCGLIIVYRVDYSSTCFTFWPLTHRFLFVISFMNVAFICALVTWIKIT